MAKASIALLFLVLVACGPPAVETRLVIHKTGSKWGDRTRAHDECKLASFKEIPQTLATETTAGYSHPGTLQCTTNFGVTTCNQVGAVDVPATSSTYDVNSQLRERYIANCLAKQGYAVIPLTKECKTQEDIAGVKGDLESQRPADQIHCYYGQPL